MKRYEAINTVSSLLNVSIDDCWLTGSQSYGHSLYDEDDMDPTHDVDVLVCIRDEASLLKKLDELAAIPEYKLENSAEFYDNDINVKMMYEGYVLNIIALGESAFNAWVYTTMVMNFKWYAGLNTIDKKGRVVVFKAIRDAYTAGRQARQNDVTGAPPPF